MSDLALKRYAEFFKSLTADRATEQAQGEFLEEFQLHSRGAAVVAL